MHSSSLRPSLAVLALLLLPGCGYVHFGRPPEPAPMVGGDEKLLRENSDLRIEKKMLQQELAITRAQGDALRFAIENRAADGDTSKRLTEKLAEASRQLTALRADYAKLQNDRNGGVGSLSEVAALQAKLGATEDKLAAALKQHTDLNQEISNLRGELDLKRNENVALAEQVKTVTAKNEAAQAALAQLNTDLLAQKESRTKAEQDATTLRTQLDAANTRISALAAQRTGAAGDAKSISAETAAGGDAAELRTQLETLRKKVWSLEAERTELQQQLSVAEAKIKAPGAAEAKALADALASAKMLRAETDTLKTANADLTKAKTDLENQLAKAQAALPTAVGAIREELAQTQVLVTQLTDENARLKARIGAGGATTGVTRPPSGVNATLVTNTGGTPAPASNNVIVRTGAQPRYHTVTSGDTLARISILYYGTPARWTDILNANRDVLGEDNNLVIGRTLRVP